MAKPDAIRSVRDLQAGINMLIYGDNGSAKTPLIGSSEDCLILNCDPPDAVMSARVAGSTADVWQIRDWNDADEAREYLQHERHPYRWVWCDSGTGLQFGGMEQIMDDLVIAKPHRERYVPDQGEYLKNMNRLKTWVRIMSGLPFNFGITSHPFRWTPEDEEEELVWPFFQGKGMPALICGYMNVIGFVRIRRVEGADKKPKDVQTLYTKNLPNYYARDRFSAIPSPMNNPTIPVIEKAIMDKVGGAVREHKKATTVKPGAVRVPRISQPAKAVAKKIPQRRK